MTCFSVGLYLRIIVYLTLDHDPDTHSWQLKSFRTKTKSKQAKHWQAMIIWRRHHETFLSTFSRVSHKSYICLVYFSIMMHGIIMMRMKRNHICKQWPILNIDTEYCWPLHCTVNTSFTITVHSFKKILLFGTKKRFLRF